MSEETIFSKIIRKEIPSDMVYQDDSVTAFRDINPKAPTHILIIPNKVIPTVADVKKEDETSLSKTKPVSGNKSKPGAVEETN